jgi:hypothetical protein
MTMQRHRRPRGCRQAPVSLAVVLAAAACVSAVASGRTTAVPSNTAVPTISGSAREGQTLTASNGTWTNSPTTFSYQWQRCTESGSGCTDISGATSKTYTLATADVDHTVRVIVTASNADGQSTATSKTTDLVSSKSSPVNTTKPIVRGTAQVGEELNATTGSWTGGVTTYGYQWQRCGPDCADVAGATGNTYGVRSADLGKALRVVVTAKSTGGSTSASSDLTGIVRAAGGAPPQPAPAPGNKAPTLSFISLKRIGARLYARFRVCDDSSSTVTVTERDTRPGRLAYTRRFSVAPTCTATTRNWVPAARFRAHGRMFVTLRATDKSGASSSTLKRGINF